MSLKIWTVEDKRLTMTDLNGNFAAVINLSIYNEDLSAYTNGADITFNTTQTFNPGTLKVYVSDGPTGALNRQMPGASYDYVEVINVDGEGEGFTFNSFVPPTDSKLLVDYDKATP